jgi:hypothetical protein
MGWTYNDTDEDSNTNTDTLSGGIHQASQEYQKITPVSVRDSN